MDEYNKQYGNNSQYSSLYVLVAGYKWVFVVLICTIIIFKECVFNNTDVLDKGGVSWHMVYSCNFYDSSYNGFSVDFRSAVRMTEKRVNEYRSSEVFMEFNKSMKSLRDSVFHSGGLLVASDPYQIVDLIFRLRIPDSIQIYKIQGIGEDKLSLYRRPNPYDSTMVTHIKNTVDIPDFSRTPSRHKHSGKTVLFKTKDQGMVFIDHVDISNYIHSHKQRKHYQYSECSAHSNTDEQFSHIGWSGF